MVHHQAGVSRSWETYMMMVGWSMYEMSVQNRSQAALAICSISDDDGAAV